jgi:hypothetical protein
MNQWPVEDIPDEDIVYRCVHRRAYSPDGELTNAVFSDDGTGVSVDWAKYSTASQARSRRSAPEDNAVYSLYVREVRQTKKYPGSLQICHTPDLASSNRAHTSIYGFHEMERTMKVIVREELLDILKHRGAIIPL